ncbi:hypothetical protein HU200_004903 [Digitaria exilis]|uniref:Uncharacterized protein n=1 Tax=Digitaria exilis TaxID=1010633 RepID=A0A835FUM2_9POAL|nr:hypothetical protein HU200_004903 [Digitaria exilis]
MTTAIAAASLLPCRRLPPPPPALALPDAATASSTVPRHVGQESWESSHVSTQRTWKPWAHRGSTRTLSPSANSPRQMAQTSAATAGAPSAPYTSTGMLRSARRLSPPPPPAPPAASRSDAARRAQRMRQRASELRPSAKRRAKSSAARMMTMLVSKLPSLVPPGPGLLLLSACCAASSAIPGAGDSGGPMTRAPPSSLLFTSRLVHQSTTTGRGASAINHAPPVQVTQLLDGKKGRRRCRCINHDGCHEQREHSFHFSTCSICLGLEN